MAKDESFDIVSDFDQQELVNALDQARREIGSRFDLKDSGSEVNFEEGKHLVLTAPDEFKLKNIFDIVESKITKRGMSPHILDPQKVEQALGGKTKQTVLLRKGLKQEEAKEIVAEIKGTKLKVQPSIQGEQIRVSGKSRDDLQLAMKAAREFGERKALPLQFTNYR